MLGGKVTKLKLTVVTPVFNEEDGIAHFHARTRRVLDSLEDIEANILFVVDRSTDNTLEVLRGIVAQDPASKAISLSSRFGHQMTLLAGIEGAVNSDVIVMMDSDLQHPPELIPQLLEQYRAGADVVYTVRRHTMEGSVIRRVIGNLTYRVMRFLLRVPINADAADFRLISRRVAKSLVYDFQERNVFLRGLFSWIGFKQIGVEYVAEPRFAGESKYSLIMLFQLAINGILSFSTRPLYLGIFVGVGFACLAFIYLGVAVITFFIDRSIPSGWTTLVVLSLLFSGVQLIVLGILGIYTGGIYEEVKKRPRYIIDEVISHHDRSS